MLSAEERRTEKDGMGEDSKFPGLRTEGDTIRSSKALGASNFGSHLFFLSD